jgi:16S rRNA (uracil1498-N3)-methyltransferase
LTAPAADGSPFFLVDRVPGPGPFLLDGPEGRHAATVRRLRTGERLVLTDGRGGWAAASVTGALKSELQLDVGPAHTTAPPRLQVTVVQALPKGERSELAVDLATEAGADRIVPWAAARCVVRWTGDKAVKGVQKWRTVAREAAKQARRVHVPEVAELATTAQVADLLRAADLALVLHEAATASLPSIPLPAAGTVLLVIGPEGGIGPDEVGTLTAAGGRPTRLGPEVLRTSSAAAVALGALAALSDRWWTKGEENPSTGPAPGASAAPNEGVDA